MRRAARRSGGENDESRRLSELALRQARAAGSARVPALAHIGLSRADFRDAAYEDGLEHADLADELARCRALVAGAQDG